MMVGMGALVTMELAADAPQHDLPWIITFGPLDEDEDWEPVVCGPYERPHAMAMAQHLVADAEILAVVEPLLPATTLAEIKAQIELAQRDALDLAAEEDDDALDTDFEDMHFDDDGHDHSGHDHDHGPAEEPSPAEIKAAFARISARLTEGI
jgi:pimeloyl-ACP methyl ester carboxylesterase